MISIIRGFLRSHVHSAKRYIITMAIFCPLYLTATKVRVCKLPWLVVCIAHTTAVYMRMLLYQFYWQQHEISEATKIIGCACHVHRESVCIKVHVYLTFLLHIAFIMMFGPFFLQQWNNYEIKMLSCFHCRWVFDLRKTSLWSKTQTALRSSGKWDNIMFIFMTSIKLKNIVATYQRYCFDGPIILLTMI